MRLSDPGAVEAIAYNLRLLLRLLLHLLRPWLLCVGLRGCDLGDRPSPARRSYYIKATRRR